MKWFCCIALLGTLLRACTIKMAKGALPRSLVMVGTRVSPRSMCKRPAENLERPKAHYTKQGRLQAGIERSVPWSERPLTPAARCPLRDTPLAVSTRT